MQKRILDVKGTMDEMTTSTFRVFTKNNTKNKKKFIVLNMPMDVSFECGKLKRGLKTQLTQLQSPDCESLMIVLVIPSLADSPHGSLVACTQ
jgi:preprotein translocase subunit Sec63